MNHPAPSETAVVFLSKKPHAETIAFGEFVAANTLFLVYVISDDPSDGHPNAHNLERMGKICFQVVYLDTDARQRNGFQGCNIGSGQTHLNKDVIAWDKFLYLFTSVKPYCDFKFVWVFEDDVFIPNICTISNLHYNYGKHDLVTPNHHLKIDQIKDWHWQHVFDSHSAPYYYSMVCAAGMSRKMLDAVKNHVNGHKKLFHIEAMFNTLAHHAGLSVHPAFELRSVVWQGEWGIDEFILLKNNVFHPKKDLENFGNYRKLIDGCKKMGYKPANRLPHFLAVSYYAAMRSFVVAADFNEKNDISGQLTVNHHKQT